MSFFWVGLREVICFLGDGDYPKGLLFLGVMGRRGLVVSQSRKVRVFLVCF